MDRMYREALVVGLCIGIAALLLDHWLGYRSWPLRIFALTMVGGGICVLQYALARFWRR